jgi:hypothetical protein
MAFKKGTDKNPIITKINRATKVIRCPVKGCKEQCFVDGTMVRNIPYGFGAGSGKYNGKFVVEFIKQKGWWCECPKHGRIFAYYSVTKVTKVPRKINAKLRDARVSIKSGR